MSVILDGTTDFYNGPNVQVSSSKTATCSIWFKTGTVDTDTRALLVARSTGIGASGFFLAISIGGAFDRISVIGRNSATSLIFSLVKNSTGFVSDTRYNLMLSWDIENSVGNMFLNGVDQSPTKTFSLDEVVPYSDASAWQVGAFTDDSDVPGNMFNGTFDDTYFTTNLIDLTTSANRRLFYGREGTTVGLGHLGRRPTDSQPEILLTHGPNNYGFNAGFAGDFSTVGAPTFSRGLANPSNTLSRGFYGERWRESERSGIPFRESRLVIEPASGLEVARREFSTDRDEINRRKRFGTTIFEH